jgi:holdfast attachment protein HfaA
LLEPVRIVLSWSEKLMLDRVSRKLALVLLAATAGLGVAGLAEAQTMNNNGAGYNAGYGRVAGQENQPVDVSLRDANGNLVIVDGVIQAGQDQSVFATAGASGVVDTVAGVGATGGASAIGNNLTVVTQGDWNTVIVNSVQNNSGNITAQTGVSGGNNGH